MSKLEELIEKLCPNGVEYKKLGKFCEIKTGVGITKKDTVENGKYKIISGGIEPLGLCNICNRKTNTVTIARAGSAGFVNYITEDFYLNDKCFSIIPDDSVNSKFLYYALKNIQENIYSLKSSGTVPTVNTEKVANIYIPVPPMEVQCEIVHILDDFTLLSAELSAELKARREQFNYYRSKLFEKYLSDFVELDSIGDVTKLAGFEFTKYVKYSQEGNIIALRGLNVKDGRLVLNDIKYIDNSDFSKLERSKLYKNDLLYTYVGTVGQVGLVDQNNKYYLAPNVARIRINNSKVLPKFVMYFLQTPEFKVNQLDKLTGASSMKNITMTNIRKFKIPLPSIEEQERIVNILDRLDKLCNDISEGLPAEIEARQKQYEYYRDKLLTFKELKVNE